MKKLFILVIGFIMTGCGAGGNPPVPPKPNPNLVATKPDFAEVKEGEVVEICVLCNDDQSIAKNSVLITKKPEHGTIITNPINGIVRYIPDSGFYGQDSFTYKARDFRGNPTAETEVVVTVLKNTENNGGARCINENPKDSNTFTCDFEEPKSGTKKVMVVIDDGKEKIAKNFEITNIGTHQVLVRAYNSAKKLLQEEKVEIEIHYIADFEIITKPNFFILSAKNLEQTKTLVWLLPDETKKFGPKIAISKTFANEKISLVVTTKEGYHDMVTKKLEEK